MWGTAKLGCIPLAAAALLFIASVAHAGFPERPVKLIVPYPPGGGTDVIARLIGQKLSELWRQPVVVENKGGGETLLGTALVAQAVPDGYTLGVVTPTFTINKTLFPKAPFNAADDLVPVAMLASSPLVLVMNPRVEAKDLAGLVALSRKYPDKTNYSSSSSITLVVGEMFKKITGVQATHVPYKGSSPSVMAVVSGDVTYTLDTIIMTKPLIEAGRLRAIGVTSKERSPILPSVAPIAESGVVDFEAAAWYGLIAPRGVPADIIAKVNSDINSILAMADVREKLALLGATPLVMTPAAFGDVLRGDMQKYDEIIKTAPIALVE